MGMAKSALCEGKTPPFYSTHFPLKPVGDTTLTYLLRRLINGRPSGWRTRICKRSCGDG